MPLQPPMTSIGYLGETKGIISFYPGVAQHTGESPYGRRGKTAIPASFSSNSSFYCQFVTNVPYGSTFAPRFYSLNTIAHTGPLYTDTMKKQHKDHVNGAPENEPVNMDDEKLFDFDKADAAEANEKSGSDSNEQVAELQAAVQELKDKHLRLLAEFDNYKKRTMRERLELMNSASKDVLVSLLPVLDDFDRAKKSADDPNNAEVFSDGVSLVYNRLHNILQNMGLKAITSNGETFDVELHEAITEIPVPDENKKGKVIDTLEKGYTLNDKIIRHAKVVVGN